MDLIVSRRSWLVGLACLLLSTAVLAPALGESVSGAASAPSSRELSLDQRVAYQRRIEEVHWRHTTWPEVNPKPKPPLAEVMSDAAIRAKVDDALRKSAALQAYWQRPLTAEQLQAEIERMARGTRQPEVLRELFAALDNDPLVIAECLARPVLADRLLRNWYAYDERFHGAVRAAAESALAGGVTASSLPTVAERYEEVVFELERDGADAELAEKAAAPGETHALRLDEEEWSEEVRRLAGRFGARSTARLTAGPAGDEIAALLAALPLGGVSALEESADGWSVVTVLARGEGSARLGFAQWPKQAFSTWWSGTREELEPATKSVAGAYTVPTVSAEAGCTPDSWRISVQEASPSPRSVHTAVWTGERMIVWGGVANDGWTNTGDVYDPATDSWTRTAVEGAPTARFDYTAVWTGDRMIVWGGYYNYGYVTEYRNTGGVYDPVTDMWTPTSVAGAPSERCLHTAVWAGDRMIVWGGYDGYGGLSTGGVYEPATGSWTPTAVEGAPSARMGHTAVWTGARMIVWGGSGYDDFSTGGVYDPTTDRWTPTSVEGAPTSRRGHTAVWTGARMIVWGGGAGYDYFNTGGVYDPATDRWTPTAVGGAPSARSSHTAVWTGACVIVWGGYANGNYTSGLDTGGVYDPETNRWTSTTVEGAPTARSSHTAVWTGDRMIVWGGEYFDGRRSVLNTGGVYDPATDRWTPTASEGAPSERHGHTAVWTGERMIVWGGEWSPNTGDVYDPATDSWTPTAVEGAPSERYGHTAVWTGERMIVWGGYGVDGYANTGGVYDPATDSWTPTSLEGAPSRRYVHTAVWTGERMIVWGGAGVGGGDTGGAYDPATDSWAPTAVEGAPSGRSGHTAVWTGERMIVWGGWDGGHLNTGGVYDPATDRWTLTAVEGAPSERYGHTAVWTGARMIVWGGGRVLTSTGGVYDPATDHWTPTALEDAPSARWNHTAVWTGDRMIVWGGGGNTGGVYDHATDSWTPTAVEGAPSARETHTAIYTGSEMLIWGGWPHSSELGAYCVATSTLTFTSSECGTTIQVEPGETVAFTVTAADAPERTVTLDATGLPPDAGMDPALPLTGNPVSSEFTWTTDASDSNSVHSVVFTAVNDLQSSARCEVTIEVGEGTLVTLTSFTAAPGDGRITLRWTTAAEVDTAGFYLLRHDLHAGTTIRLDQALIPARGDVFLGADYSYTDETALNGVEYSYTLVDVELSGRETRHPAVRAVPNPPQPTVKLLSPAYGAALGPGEIPAFEWTPATRRGQRVVISTDPTFTDPSQAVRFEPGTRGFRRIDGPGADGARPVPAHWTDVLPLGAPLYWRVEQSGAPGRVTSSDTYYFRYTAR